ncbi:hypothetical protein FQN49_008043 [Arthroderma sp. PD_2]|nr:hypothetical protein FQN49_008043 [Arthroderma sp. PD_2]
MSPVKYGCVICGYLIESYGSSAWLKDFRAIYSNAEGTFISGVGRYDDPNIGIWIAPPDCSRRWDDPGYDSPLSDAIPVMQQNPENGLHGFVLHDSCWLLLQKFYEPDDVPIERLFSICKSLPFPLRGIDVCWGHNYGGLITFDTKDHYPWEDRVTEQYNSSQTHAKENPYDILEIPNLLILSSKSPQKPINAEPISIIETSDCFAIFPWEIIEAISINLLIPDILSLVQASKSFHLILTSQAFWASRFGPGKDRDFVFEKRNCREPRDWAKLYQLTNRSLCPPGLKNRRRIWDLIHAFSPSITSRLDKSLEYSPLKLKVCEERREVAGEIRPEADSNSRWLFNIGCKLFRKQSVIVSPALSRIAFSVTANSVTGMRLISNNQEDTCLGYINNDEQLFLELAAIRGFILAIGSHGIQAIRVIDNNGHASKWFGDPVGAPVTERLAGFGHITTLEVGVDGYKIISIAATGPSQKPRDRSLRVMAFWYPTVPSPKLHLNDQYYTGGDPSTSGYLPLIWIQFGGPGGIYLKNITGICVTRLGSLCCIEFEYDTDIPVESRKLGRRKTTDFSRVTRFQIDGRSGEFIRNIDVSTEITDGINVHHLYKFGMLRSFKVTTNHGRSMHFKPYSSEIEEYTLTPLSLAPGTTLTGLYASQHPELGLVSLGAMSEVINNNKRKRESESKPNEAPIRPQQQTT